MLTKQQISQEIQLIIYSSLVNQFKPVEAYERLKDLAEQLEDENEEDAEKK